MKSKKYLQKSTFLGKDLFLCSSFLFLKFCSALFKRRLKSYFLPVLLLAIVFVLGTSARFCSLIFSLHVRGDAACESNSSVLSDIDYTLASPGGDFFWMLILNPITKVFETFCLTWAYQINTAGLSQVILMQKRKGEARATDAVN